MCAHGERDLEGPLAGGDHEIADRRASVRGRQVIGGRARSLEDERVGGQGVERSRGPEQGVGDRRTGCLDGGLAGAALLGVMEDAVLRRLEPDDRRRGEAEREHSEDERLSAISAQGVHSISRAASPRTTSAGSPMKDSGAAIA